MIRLRIMKIQKVGTSLAVVLPVGVLRALNLERGDMMAVGIYEEDVICIRKISQKQLQEFRPPQIEYET